MRALNIVGLVVLGIAAIVLVALVFQEPAQVPSYLYAAFFLIIAMGVTANLTARRRRRQQTF